MTSLLSPGDPTEYSPAAVESVWGYERPGQGGYHHATILGPTTRAGRRHPEQV